LIFVTRARGEQSRTRARGRLTIVKSSAVAGPTLSSTNEIVEEVKMTAAPSPRKLLLAADGSELALAATRCLVSLFGADAAATEVVVANVQHGTRFVELAMGPTERAMEEARTHQGRAAAHAACELLERAGFRYRLDVRTGEDVASEIDMCAREHGCSLIVIGPRGLGRFGEFVLGSVATKLIHHSKIPVLLGR
jgi:nucleotide-binding universal stress UspA family protein